ncbi:transposase [Sutcliffiella horikoshii]|uniref:transposase n=1 Tax=Sutcliffiella horikoshii TaxID=79883 RepID=UPI00203A87FA|nr:transposase [Sutcliffiella horikoshii]MCM3617916.1 transposase [Sutcliffiella horikoshii]
MPREARKTSKTRMYHIMIRGINRQTIFEEEEDKERFLLTLKKYQEKSDYKVYAYCLMDNHIHLLIKESEEEPLSLAVKRISSSYVFWYNWKYQRIGHLFQERYKSETIETKDYFLTVLRYIHQNPLKAGLASCVFTSKWTSITEYLSHPSIIETKPVFNLFSTNHREALHHFKQYMNKPNDDQCLDYTFKLTDSEVRVYLSELGITNKNKLQQMDPYDRNSILIELKKQKGISNVQIARITGISKSVIQRLQ